MSRRNKVNLYKKLEQSWWGNYPVERKGYRLIYGSFGRGSGWYCRECGSRIAQESVEFRLHRCQNRSTFWRRHIHKPKRREPVARMGRGR